MTPLVSVILPLHNGERYLAEALNSVFAQDYRPLEVIVVDDASTDGGPALARSYPDVRCLSQPQQGVAAARNRGVAEASGEYVAFLDQDDLWMPDKLTVQAGHLTDNPNIAYSIAYVRHFLEMGAVMPTWLKPELLTQDLPGITPGNLVARRSAFARIGLFDTAYEMTSDSDWFARAKDAGLPMNLHAETLLLKRVHGSNHSFNVSLSSRELLKTLKASIDRRRQCDGGAVIGR